MRTLVENALAAALMVPDEGATPGAVHQNRSKNFVESLAAELRNRHAECADVCVFSKYFAGNRKLHGLNELMYDVAVCETKQVPSSTGRAQLAYVSCLLLAVESEMAKDTREALFDFSKLVMGRAQTNLFVGPQVSDETSYLGSLGPAADHCSGKTFVALVPHPAEWMGERHASVRMWLRLRGEWVPV